MVTDEELCARAREGDAAAFDQLYARYEQVLFGFLLRLLGDRAEAEEAFHDTFLKVLEAATVRFDGAQRFSSWLFRIARNVCANRFRRHHRGEGVLRRLAAASDETVTAEDQLAERERASALSQAVLGLPHTLADVFHLRTSGLSYEEIAGVLDVPLGTVKSRMNALVTQLKESLP